MPTILQPPAADIFNAISTREKIDIAKCDIAIARQAVAIVLAEMRTPLPSDNNIPSKVLPLSAKETSDIQLNHHLKRDLKLDKLDQVSLFYEIEKLIHVSTDQITELFEKSGMDLSVRQIAKTVHALRSLWMNASVHVA